LGALRRGEDPWADLKSGRRSSRLPAMCSKIEKMFFLPVIACAQLA
jgi:hypothetical protein